MRKLKMITLTLVAIVFATACTNVGNEKTIKIAYANWAEGIAMTHMLKNILVEQGYKVELLNADIAPIYASISRQKADVFMDMWLPVTHKDYMNQYSDKLEILGDLYTEARIGLVVPTYVTINTIEELNSHKEKFDSKIVGIDAGAGIMSATEQAINTYNLDFVLQTSSGPAMTASLKKAIDAQQWIVVTGWTPHWIFARFNLKMLEDPRNVYGAAETVHSVAWRGFSEKDPFAAQLIANIHMDNQQISSLMTALEQTQTSEEQAAAEWIEEHRELVDSWIPVVAQ